MKYTLDSNIRETGNKVHYETNTSYHKDVMSFKTIFRHYDYNEIRRSQQKIHEIRSFILLSIYTIFIIRNHVIHQVLYMTSGRP